LLSREPSGRIGFLRKNSRLRKVPCGQFSPPVIYLRGTLITCPTRIEGINFTSHEPPKVRDCGLTTKPFLRDTFPCFDQVVPNLCPLQDSPKEFYSTNDLLFFSSPYGTAPPVRPQTPNPSPHREVPIDTHPPHAAETSRNPAVTASANDVSSSPQGRIYTFNDTVYVPFD